MLKLKLIAVGVASAALLVGCLDVLKSDNGSGIAAGTQADVAFLETTDVHSNVLSYDYFKLAADSSIGFERTSTLIQAARAQYPNNFLVDNGDTIQGTALADYQALVNPVSCNNTLAVYKAMNSVNYDVGGIGNHEFNYGLNFLSQVTGNAFNVDGVTAHGCAGPQFPQVLANVLSVKDNQPIFKPYIILTKRIQATGPDGKAVMVPLRVGFLGFTPPPIMSWDKRWLDGKVYTSGLVETANKYVPEMRANGADLVVAISHGGLDNSPYSPTMENGNYYLSQVPGIDAMLIGHSHQVFPDANSKVAQFNLPGVDKAAGLVNGVPTVMANFWGKHLGVIKFHVAFQGNKWVVDPKQTVVQARSIKNADGTYQAADPTIEPLIDTEHQATIAYVKTPIGNTNFRMSTYFADAGDMTAMQIVNQAQRDYVTRYVQQNLPQYTNLPVLSVTAPFKIGFAGATDYTDVASGALAINNAADLYLYPNTIQAVKVTGADIKAWLETAASRFNKIDPTQTAPQTLVSTFPGYNFDVLQGAPGEIHYQIDVTQPLGQRIVNLTFRGAPMDPAASFIVATNNYRASGGGNFPGLTGGTKTILQSTDANRDVLIQYIKNLGSLTQINNGQDRSWSFVPVVTAGPVTLRAAPGVLGVATADGVKGISLLNNTPDIQGDVTYAIDLSAQ